MRKIVLAATILAAAAGAARAEDVWHLYVNEEGGGTLVVLDRDELESPEPYWPFALQCLPGEPWKMLVGGVDAAALGATISRSEPVILSMVVNGEEGGGGLGGYFPDIRFGEMFGEWEYSVALDMGMIEEMGGATSLAVRGTGVDRALPQADLQGKMFAFAERCGPLEGR